MHDVIQNGLEEYLGGQVRRDFQAHLNECDECRAEVRQFEEFGALFDSLQEPEPVAIDPGFYFRVTKRIEVAAEAPSFWDIFSLDAVFGRRVAFASLMTLALVGSFLISNETGYDTPGVTGPEAVMASHDVAAPHDSVSDRDRVFASLASYEQQ